MRRTLNVKFLLCLLVGIAVTSGGAALAHHLQYRRIPLALLRQAQKAEKENDSRRADDYLTRYLEFEPSDIEQKARLAKLLAASSKKNTAAARADTGRAFFLLQYVLARDTQRQDLRSLFVPLAIQLGELEAAFEQLNLMPSGAEALGLWGRWYQAKGENHTDNAVGSYSQALKLNPADVETANRFARLIRSRIWSKELPKDAAAKRESDAREADSAMDKLIKASPDSWQARLARWNYRRDYYLFERRGEKRHTLLEFLVLDAVKDVARALELREGEADVRLAASEAERMQDNLEAARAHLEKARQLHGKEPRVFKAFASLELLHEERETKPENKQKWRAAAISCLKKGTEELKPPTQFELLWAYASLLLDTGKPRELDEAAAAINRIRVLNISPAGSDFLQGRLLMGRQQWAESAKMLERARPVLSASPDVANQIDLLLARCFEELNEPQQKFDACRRIYLRNPLSVSARHALAEAYRSLNKLDDAIRLYSETMQSFELPAGAWIDYMRLAIVKAKQSNAGAGWERIDLAFDEAMKKNQASGPEIAIVKAESWLARELPDKAREVLNEAKTKNPERAELWAALAVLAERQKLPDLVVNILNEADRIIKEPAGKVELLLTRANYLVGRRSKEKKDELLKLSSGFERFEQRDRYRLLHGLAEANYRAGNHEEGGRLWKVLAKEEHYKSDLRLRLVLFDLALQEGNNEEMERLLAEIRNLEGGDGTFARHAEALRLVWLVKKKNLIGEKRNETLTQATRLLDQVKAARPTWSAALLAQAEIETLRGNPDQAAAAFQRAFDLGDRSPAVVRQLIETLRKQQKFEQAEKLLARLSKEDRDRSDLDRAQVQIMLLLNKTDDAIDLMLKSVRDDSRDYRDHLWWGQVLAGSGRKLELAEEHLRKAVQLEGKESETWVALVRFLASLKDAKRKNDAQAMLGIIETSVKPEEMPLAMAQCHSALGDDKKAREFYEKAVKERPKDAAILGDYASFLLQRNELKEAEKLVRTILKDGVQKTVEEAEWAHGRLAVLLSANEDFTRFMEALPHVGLRMEASGEIVRDDSLVRAESLIIRRLGARVLASNPQWRCRDEAIKRFEELEQRQVLAADDRYILSRLYEMKGDWPKAHRQLSEIALARDRQPHHLIAHAQGLLANHQPRPAETIIDRLEAAHKASPWPGGDLALVELRARWHEARREGDKAIELIRDFMKRSGSRPQSVLLVVSSLARQKRFAAALDLADEVWKVCPPEMAGGTCVALLRSARASKGQHERIEKLLRDAAGKDAKNANLLVQLGDVLDLNGNYEQAEKQYRDALRLDEKNVLALNNLAWLLTKRNQRGSEALELINRAIAAVGGRGELLDTRAIVYLTIGKTDLAQADLQEALKESMSAARCFHLAQVYHAANNKDAARRSLLQANDLGLQAAELHPAEQVEYRKLKEQLGQQ